MIMGISSPGTGEEYDTEGVDEGLVQGRDRALACVYV